ncbi:MULTISPECIES: 4Fe-4S binding protein [Gordonibacter]|uniref:4Fe-4S binding protein n=1 Tax=Gordonibacter faecis TaxID=3047475 RepID=A0ABT7DNS1_9ACTN|nr:MULTISPECIES: 4Fe-4S binding protein [unclassified Gordonibacter]MDJ1651186.1 4Fe-4S binding protein [Gordonibacter sp. KGMB12511]HIW77348.1 4Fe-4S binding protein [Candidatus Gordonibacter avicola]
MDATTETAAQAREEQAVDAAFCLDFLRSVRDVAFATVDARGLPAVRIIDVMMVEDGRLYFVAARGKAFYAEVMRDRYVALCGLSPDYRTCRLRGPVEHPDDEAEQHRLIDRVFELNPSMNEVYPGEARYVLEAFYLEHGQGEYFDLGQHPIFRTSFTLGGDEEELDGFTVTTRCIGCGTCVDRCPQSCITLDAEGRAHINQHACLRCGLCREICPEAAIEPR